MSSFASTWACGPAASWRPNTSIPIRRSVFSIAQRHTSLCASMGRNVSTGQARRLRFPVARPRMVEQQGRRTTRHPRLCSPGRFAEFITTFFAMAVAGKTNARGLPKDVLQLGVTLADRPVM